MHPLLRVLALLVLALWWPATVHCQIEAALALQSPHCHAESDCTPSANDEQHAHDNCGLIEDVGYKAGGSPLLVAAPTLAFAGLSAAPLPRLGGRFCPGIILGHGQVHRDVGPGLDL